MESNKNIRNFSMGNANLKKPDCNSCRYSKSVPPLIFLNKIKNPNNSAYFSEKSLEFGPVCEEPTGSYSWN